MKLYKGDCLDIMAAMEPDSIDTIITDPPYGLGFMGKEWDHGVPGIPFWEAALRVAKPGAILLAFGGTRTSHRLACAIEDAGWEIRDTIVWLYASGFPKSHSIGKALDRAAGKKRGVVGVVDRAGKKVGTYGAFAGPSPITTPATDAAKLWDGWGTALAPSHEPIILAMKPRDGTFASNACKWGCAGLNIDGARIPTGQDYNEAGWGPRYGASSMPNMGGHQTRPWVQDAMAQDKPVKDSQPSKLGRWPKNTILSCSCDSIDWCDCDDAQE